MNFNVAPPATFARRGKRNQKHYTVFYADVPPDTRSSYTPRLNREHSAWRWFDVRELRARAGLEGPSVRGAAAAAVEGQGEAIELHPVVLILLGLEELK